MRSKTILTTAAILAVAAAPAYGDPAPWENLRTPEARPYVLERDYGSPDAADAARDTSPVPVGAPGVYPETERKLVESPEVQQMQQRLSREIRANTAVVEVRGASGGFDWGDAGIGAAGMLALLCIAGGSALLLTSPRRRRDVSATVH